MKMINQLLNGFSQRQFSLLWPKLHWPNARPAPNGSDDDVGGDNGGDDGDGDGGDDGDGDASSMVMECG